MHINPILRIIVYYQDYASRYLLYVPPEAMLPGSKLPLGQQILLITLSTLVQPKLLIEKISNFTNQTYIWMWLIIAYLPEKQPVQS